ncbi:MAG: DUF3536 domain-containing protein [Myxococcota bacterium]
MVALAPGQAHRIRPLGGRRYQDVSGGRVDPGRAYRVTTKSGRHISVFFYDGLISQAVAFERLLRDGRVFAERLTSARNEPGPVLSHIATDGETYGHHHRHGDMALAYSLFHIASSGDNQLTNYGEFLDRHPPEYEAEIFENTAWSCAHGVGRWSRDCSCHTGANPDWNQRWRKPLRWALDWLRDRLVALFERHAAPLLRDPWAARNDFIEVILDRSSDNVDRFLQRHAARALSPDEERTALSLLEMQRHAMLMYTSCGWFFDDLAGIEVIQILRYAARAIELAELVAAENIEPGFLDQLARAESNRPEMGDGRQIYLDHVMPSKVDLRRVIAHYAVSSLFEDQPETQQIYCYDMKALDLHVHRAGNAKLAVGTVCCTSRITRASQALSFGALHLGDHNLTGGVRQFSADKDYQAMVTDVLEAFDRADMVAAQRQLDRHFLDLSFSLKSLFGERQERILSRILEMPRREAETAYRQLYTRHAPLMRYLASMDLPVPAAFETAAKFTLQLGLRQALQQDLPDVRSVRASFEQAHRVGVEIEDRGMDYLWHNSLERLIDRLTEQPDELAILEQLAPLAEFCSEQRFDVDLWHTQNACYRLLSEVAEEVRQRAAAGDAPSQQWIDLFDRLCRAVRIETEVLS